MKYPKFYNSFNKYINLSVDVYLDLEKRMIRKTFKKKEFLIKEGGVIHYLPFINKGIMVNYRLDAKGDVHVIQIRDSGSWLGDLNSFFSGSITPFNIQVYQDVELLLLDHSTFEYITKEYPEFERCFRLNIQKAYGETLNQIYNLHSTSAKERYNELVQKMPSVFDHIPHYLIASYLGIKPQSLSRIKKSL